jgi:hypothetical protein
MKWLDVPTEEKNIEIPVRLSLRRVRMKNFANHIIETMKEVGVLRTIWQGSYQMAVFIFCQVCGLAILGPRSFFKKGPIN